MAENKKPPQDDEDKTTILAGGDATTLQAELNKAKEQPACLIIIRGTPQGHRYFITENEMTLGRDQSADITLMDQSISRKHARVNKSGGKLYLTDMGSINGTFVNDKKVPQGSPVELEKEDVIKVGATILKYLPQGELETLFYGNLDQAANSDPMTKAFNKGYLLQALEAEFKRAKGLHSDFSIIFFDLDHFKKINDTYGHDAGDYVLIEIGQLIRGGNLRPKDVFARYGGEEFVILLGNTNAQQAVLIAEKIRSAIEMHAFVYEGKRLPVTASVGVAELRSDIESAQTLLKIADKALYAAKTSGRNRVMTAA